MNKICNLFLILFIFITTFAYSIEKEFNGKLGTSYAKEAENFGLDISLNYLFVLDPYFAAGIEADFFWLQWERTLGKKDIGQTNATIKAKTDAYIIPVFLNAQVRFPNLTSKIYVEPSIIIGLGYSAMILDYSIPVYVDNSGIRHKSRDEVNLYNGYAWQILTSLALKPAPESNINFTFDAGFRGLFPDKNGIEFNLSGFIIRAGVKFKI